MIAKSLSAICICIILSSAVTEVNAQCDTSFYVDAAGFKQGFWKGVMEGGGFGSGCYINGQHHGTWEAYYADSTLWYREQFTMGLTIEFVKYSAKGKLQEQIHSYHTKSGFYRLDTLLHENGGMWRLSNFIYVNNTDSLKNQVQDDVIFHHFENWVFHGTHLEHFENGMLRSSTHYKMGMLHGESISFLNPASIEEADPPNFKVVNHYKNGLPHGKWRWYFSSGELSTVLKFKDGKQIKKRTFKRK